MVVIDTAPSSSGIYTGCRSHSDYVRDVITISAVTTYIYSGGKYVDSMPKDSTASERKKRSTDYLRNGARRKKHWEN